MGNNREKSNIAMAMLPFSHFDGSNNIFADCRTSWEGQTHMFKLFVLDKINIDLPSYVSTVDLFVWTNKNVKIVIYIDLLIKYI